MQTTPRRPRSLQLPLGALLLVVGVVAALLLEPRPDDAAEPSGGGRAVVLDDAALTASGLTHPGIVTSSAQLAFVKNKIAARAEPWTSAYERARTSSYGSLSYTAQPVAWVGCGSYNRPDEGCTAEMRDAQAAYTHALLWVYSGDRRHAAKAIQILNAWSATLQGHRFDTTTYKNGHLQAAWAGSVFPKAAEIIRHTGAGWSSADVQRFSTMLRTAFLPMVRDGWAGGGSNWMMSMAEATINIGVFLDDRSVFDDGVSDWRATVPSTAYLSTDGSKPLLPPARAIKASGIDAYWKQPTRYVDGLQQETCRDLDHAVLGLGATFNAAETASIQGVDLFGEQQRRLTAALEHNARFAANQSASGWVCPNPPKIIGTTVRQGWEIAYSHYAGDRGLSLPQTRAYVLSQRSATRSELHLNWQTLTHAAG
ncbi:hypothetical protein FHN55_17740 [Streptomyces sp. NP160]|uniref:alginate lyase family protein n=1 Tax=Streptomyces sp. NP160 TaxID=2586637 RepID=UPI00111AB305|nr:alginate lyase family protein [Streptomyces sp. NP160]TNM61054.1 hypothetical protein FHN55_17740 [Streptomyces sp. NP160]